MADSDPQQPINKSDNSADKEYERAISLMVYHTELLWEEFGAFLLAETVLTGFLGTALLSAAQQTKAIVAENLVLFSGSILGFLLCIPWYATFLHNYQYYRLRVEQARRHESALGMTLLSEGQKLSSGEAIRVGDMKLRLPALARCIPPRRSVPLLIAMFAFTFLVLIAITGPWWC